MEVLKLFKKKRQEARTKNQELSGLQEFYKVFNDYGNIFNF